MNGRVGGDRKDRLTLHGDFLNLIHTVLTMKNLEKKLVPMNYNSTN